MGITTQYFVKYRPHLIFRLVHNKKLDTLTLNYRIKAVYLEINFCVISYINVTPKLMSNTSYKTQKFFRTLTWSEFLFIKL